MTALKHLELALGRTNADVERYPWTQDTSIDPVLRNLQAYLKKGNNPVLPVDQQERAVAQFWTRGKLTSLKEVRLICYGLSLPVGPQQATILEDRTRLSAVLDGVDQWRFKPRQFRRCYHGLLSNYFSFDYTQRDDPSGASENWKTLRDYLGERSSRLSDGPINPDWVTCLLQHTNVLTDDPCGRYAYNVLHGDTAEVDRVRAELGIDDASWFTRKLLLAQVIAATKTADSEFRALLSRLLELIEGNLVLRDEALGLLLDRYARVNSTPLHQGLRDAAVNWWGNPWLTSNAMRWGRVQPPARSMVTEWLKLEFIETFFTVLAEEKAGDRRRLEFWKRYVKAIDHIHFALGSDARFSNRQDFVELRKKMEGLIVELRDPQPANNAFIMTMGNLVVVEFSGQNNAFYGYDSRKALPFDLTRPVVTGVNFGNSLKNSARILWLSHKDGIHGWSRWENMFEATLREQFGISTRGHNWAGRDQQPAETTSEPTSQSSTPAVLQVPLAGQYLSTPFSLEGLHRFAEAVGFKVEDLRNRNGNLWVRTDDRNIEVKHVLSTWNFRYKPGKGWWRQ
jgi:hypothetical protein